MGTARSVHGVRIACCSRPTLSLFNKEAVLVPMPGQHARYARHPTALGETKWGNNVTLAPSHLDRCITSGIGTLGLVPSPSPLKTESSVGPRSPDRLKPRFWARLKGKRQVGAWITRDRYPYIEVDAFGPVGVATEVQRNAKDVTIPTSVGRPRKEAEFDVQPLLISFPHVPNDLRLL
ncbi:hypothetical protein BC826DRAFT_968061 [Russula brevipes]|nr:hypothetical protein BC826DRAFT_968061 [Russula brevipes]